MSSRSTASAVQGWPGRSPISARSSNPSAYGERSPRPGGEGRSLHWIQLTAARLHRPGPSGAAVLLRQLATIPFEGRVPDSWFEELVALCLDDPAIPPIELQYPIRDAHGHIVAKTDIGIPSVRLGLEAHSRQFHFGPDAEPLDEQRDMAAATCGWDLQYLGWYATRRPAEVVDVVKQIIAARRPDL